MSVWISSNNYEYRRVVWMQLQKNGITTASYGRYRRNHKLTDEVDNLDWVREWDSSGPMSGNQKQAHASGHMFLFAAENSISPYYHTEKVFHGLMAGSIPIYIGADTIDDYVPDDSIIKVSDFLSIKELADYMINVSTNQTLYEKHLAWRTRPLPDKVTEKLIIGSRFGGDTWKCEICSSIGDLLRL